MKKIFYSLHTLRRTLESELELEPGTVHSISLSVHNVFYVGVWNAECLCLNLFVFRSPIPPSDVQMTHTIC